MRAKRKDKRNYGCCDEAINWKFVEFSPSSLLFLAQYLFAHCFIKFNGFESSVRAKKSTQNKNSSGFELRSRPQQIEAEGRFGERNLNNVQLSIGYGVCNSFPFALLISQLHLTFSISCKSCSLFFLFSRLQDIQVFCPRVVHIFSRFKVLIQLDKCGFL